MICQKAHPSENPKRGRGLGLGREWRVPYPPTEGSKAALCHCKLPRAGFGHEVIIVVYIWFSFSQSQMTEYVVFYSRAHSNDTTTKQRL